MNLNKSIQQQSGRFYTRAMVDNSTIIDTEEERSFWVVFATETPVYRKGWEENFNEVLVCKADAIRATRLMEGAVPLLNNHKQSDGVDGQMGRVVEYTIDNGRCLARILFSTQERYNGIWDDIKAGIIRSVSTGYNVFKYQREMPVDSTIPDYRAIDWEPLEISLTPVPADSKSLVGRKEAAQHDIIIENLLIAQNERSDMKTEKQTELIGQPLSTSANEIQIRSEAIKAERVRALDINNAVKAAKLSDSFATKLIEDGTPINEARNLIINELAKSNNKVTNTSMYSQISVDETENTRSALVEAIMHRAQPGVVKLDDKSQDFKHASLFDIAKRCLDMKGERSGRFSSSEIITRALATTDFPNVLGGTVSRVLRNYYDNLNFNWKLVATEVAATDFRTRSGVTATSKITFEEIAEGGQYKNTPLVTEEAATLKLKTYGRKITITRQAIVNDDLGFFNTLPRMLAQGAANFQADKVWGIITGNAKTPDGTVMFHANHNNLASGGALGAPSANTLTAARIAMWKQTSLAGDPLAISPKYLIVPPEHQTVAEQLVASIIANSSSSVNVFANKYDVIVDPRLTNATAWYLAADPTLVEGLVYAYLQGEGLHIENQVDFDNDTVVTKARLDFDANIWDYRGWYKNPGA